MEFPEVGWFLLAECKRISHSEIIVAVVVVVADKSLQQSVGNPAPRRSRNFDPGSALLQQTFVGHGARGAACGGRR